MQKKHSFLPMAGGRSLFIEAPKETVSYSTLLQILKSKYPEYKNYGIFTKDGLEVEKNDVTEKASFWLKTRNPIYLYMRRG